MTRFFTTCLATVAVVGLLSQSASAAFIDNMDNDDNFWFFNTGTVTVNGNSTVTLQGTTAGQGKYYAPGIKGTPGGTPEWQLADLDIDDPNNRYLQVDIDSFGGNATQVQFRFRTYSNSNAWTTETSVFLNQTGSNFISLDDVIANTNPNAAKALIWLYARDGSGTAGASDSVTFDLIQLTPVPEPGSLLLLGAGASLIAVRRRHA